MFRKRGRHLLTMLTGVGAWLVPAWGCPVCLSAFAGTSSALGLGFVATKAVLTPLTASLLAVALMAIGFGARRRRAYGPLWLAAGAAGLLIAGKYWPGEPSISYAGLAALLAASVWNTRTTAARRGAPSIEAPLCAK